MLPTSSLAGGAEPLQTDSATPAPSAPTPAPSPAAPAAVTPPAPVVPDGAAPEAPKPMSAEDVLANVRLSDLTSDQINALESGDAGRIAEALKLPEAKKPDAPVVVEPVTPAVEPPKPGDEPQSKLDRMSLKALKDMAERETLVKLVQSVKDGKYANLTEAARDVFGFKAPDPSAPVPPVGGEPVAPVAPAPDAVPVFVDESVQVLEASVEALNTELAEAKKLYDYDKQSEIVSKLSDVKVELALAKRDAQARKADFDSFVAAETVSRQNALSRYGELLTDPESGFSDHLDAEIVIAERKNDPILSQPDWPEKIAEKVFKRLYPQTPGGEQPQPTPVATTIPPAPPGLRFPGSPVAGAAAPVAMSVNDALEQMDKMSPEERLEVLALAEKSLQASRR